MKDGDIMGHKFMSIVGDAGSGVAKLSRGDRVVLSFAITCDQNFCCNKTLFSACQMNNPDRGMVISAIEPFKLPISAGQIKFEAYRPPLLVGAECASHERRHTATLIADRQI